MLRRCGAAPPRCPAPAAAPTCCASSATCSATARIELSTPTSRRSTCVGADCLHLTYYAYGDTRKRGMALLRFKHAYRNAGVDAG